MRMPSPYADAEANQEGVVVPSHYGSRSAPMNTDRRQLSEWSQPSQRSRLAAVAGGRMTLKLQIQ